MTSEDAERLRRISRFDQLVAFLRDELEWPFTDFEELDDVSFRWTADELGIDKEHAAAVEEVRQLRPPTGDWPWGIFYVKFEKKRLPITILRRALANVVRKKRETANTGQRWDMDDLLFISSYGEEEKRHISFARFQAPEGAKGLPVLKVLAWDEDDTDLSLEHTAGELKTKLRWPDDEQNVDAWRTGWASAFTRGHREAITTARDLASRLAGLAQRIRARINQVLELENQKGQLRALMTDFQGSLVHDLDKDGFADMYAQTIAYGLFSARVANPSGRDAGSMLSVPVTNPFLKELLATFLEVGGRKRGEAAIDFDELGVQDVVELLDATDMEAVLRDFGDRNPLEDPVIHFFEGFLQEYDKKTRKDRGVFYTPRPVVSFIVRSVDELLRTQFGLEDGLADTTTWGAMVDRIDGLEMPDGVSADQAFVQILDPATGTGTFLVEVIVLVFKTMKEKWLAEGYMELEVPGLWNDYVPEHLLPRLHGYELMMAPYAIAHMKIGLKLYETGYRFAGNARARLYLTNALEPAQDSSGKLVCAIPALANESAAVNAVKQDRRFTVVVGNPPYSGVSSNMSEYAQKLVDPYKVVDGAPLGERKLWLQDDYVKFIRMAQVEIERSHIGILGYITNHSYLDNTTFRGMRQSLMSTFTSLGFLDAHGNTTKAEVAPNDVKDDNVFAGIQQGVAICFGIRGGRDCGVGRADIWGARENKLSWLGSRVIGECDLTKLAPGSPYYFFKEYGERYCAEYESGWKISDAMPFNCAGVITARDGFVVDFDEERLVARIQCFKDSDQTEDTIRSKFFAGRGSRRYADGDSRGWKVPAARQRVMRDPEWRERVRPYMYRPFDKRWVYWADWMVDWPRPELSRHMVGGDNVAFHVCRQSISQSWGHVLVARGLIDDCYVSNKSRERGYAHPFFLQGLGDERSFRGSREPNLSPAFMRQLGLALSLPGASTCVDAELLEPESVFHYIYALFYSPSYRDRYSEFLKVDFPRVLMPGCQSLFASLSKLGDDLVRLHLLDNVAICDHEIGVSRVGDMRVEAISFLDEIVWIDKAKTRGFKGVPEEVWNFHIGGYQVCEKWLKDRQAKGGKNPRPGRVLTDEDIEHYQKIVVALSETIRIQAEIDEVIEAHGGWPGAFQTSEAAED